jgi:hypothetical protein
VFSTIDSYAPVSRIESLLSRDVSFVASLWRVGGLMKFSVFSREGLKPEGGELGL